jgi:hypothetical protein
VRAGARAIPWEILRKQWLMSSDLSSERSCPKRAIDPLQSAHCLWLDRGRSSCAHVFRELLQVTLEPIGLVVTKCAHAIGTTGISRSLFNSSGDAGWFGIAPPLNA